MIFVPWEKVAGVSILVVVTFIIGSVFGYSYHRNRHQNDIAEIEANAENAVLRANIETRSTEEQLKISINSINKTKKEQKDENQREYESVIAKLHDGYGMRVQLDSCSSGLPKDSTATNRDDGEEASGFLSKSSEEFFTKEAYRADQNTIERNKFAEIYLEVWNKLEKNYAQH